MLSNICFQFDKFGNLLPIVMFIQHIEEKKDSKYFWINEMDESNEINDSCKAVQT